MAGGLIQVVSYGNQDLMLSGNPEITFFNIIYRRYTNFGKKIIELGFDNDVDFGKTSILTIPKNSGDLLTKLILKIKLPSISLQNLNSNLFINSSIINNQDTSNSSTYFLYYDFFISFYNNLFNVVNIFLTNPDNAVTTTYINDLYLFIQDKINNDKYEQFYTAVTFYFNDGLVSEQNVVNVSVFTNASLFKKVNDNFIYIYQNLKESEVSFQEFSFTIYKNMSILRELNTILYTKLKNLFVQNRSIKIAWINKIAIYLFESIEFYIGSNKIVKLSDYYINNYGDLWYKNPEVYNRMIGNLDQINLFNITKEETYLYLPIPFWFLNNYGLSFPLIALQFNTIQVRINLHKFIDCIKIEFDKRFFDSKIEGKIIDFILNNNNDIVKTKLEVTMLAEYVYLDRIERKKFAQSSHEYLITQVQELEFNNLTINNNSFVLDFFHCCKDIYWQVVKTRNYRDIFSEIFDSTKFSVLKKIYLEGNQSIIVNYINTLYRSGKYYNPNDFIVGRSLFNNDVYINEFYKLLLSYISDTVDNYVTIYPLITSSVLYLNGTILIGENSNFFNYAIPYNYYNSSPQKGIYAYSFALNPTETQPSGTINLSRIPSFQIRVSLNEIAISLLTNYYNSNIKQSVKTNNMAAVMNTELKLVVQVTNFNVLRIIGGISATAYSY